MSSSKLPGGPHKGDDDLEDLGTARTTDAGDTDMTGAEPSTQLIHEDVGISAITRCPFKADENDPLPEEMDDSHFVWHRLVPGPRTSIHHVVREVQPSAVTGSAASEGQDERKYLFPPHPPLSSFTFES